jgi:argininosuccinate lyase
MRKAASAGYSTATDLADWLVQKLGLPFREAHEITGRVVRRAEALKRPLHKLPLDEFRAIEPRIDPSLYTVLGASQSAASRTSQGGTAPANVRKEARRWLARLAKEAKSA